MEKTIMSGTFINGPFEQTKVVVYAMAMGLLEDAVMDQMMLDPEKKEQLLKYMLSDPRLKAKSTLAN